MDYKKQEEQIEEIISYYQKQPQEQENYRAMLEELQGVLGFLPQSVLERAARALEIKVTVLNCLVKFSSALKLAPYQHKIVACTGERCGRKDSPSLLQLLKDELKTDKDGLSYDKKILLVTQNCLKNCKTSPNLMIDGEICPHMTKERLMGILNNLK
ncbi:MAG: NAD(P)H-dependent oxidoreductase subunit E [Eubacteriales bacterium]|nr:NAD(P)H-dependent oxidoreductase subunit E [Eubacteriales bacterium]